MKLLYLIVDLFTIAIPAAFSFHSKIQFNKQWKYFLLANLPVTILFILWDIYFTKSGVWNFNSKYITGIYFFNLPIEEVLFFICIPFSCVFTYFCFNKFLDLRWNKTFEKIFTFTFSLLLLLFGIKHRDNIYTSSTLISTAILCMLLKFIIKIKWFGNFVTVYLILLIPFFIVNGILTGTAIEEPVVIYNSAEITGLRLITIPLEDIFYGFEMVLLNIFLFNTLKKFFKLKHKL